MVSLDDLVALVTLGTPVDASSRVASPSRPAPPPPSPPPPSMDSKEEEKAGAGGGDSNSKSSSSKSSGSSMLAVNLGGAPPPEEVEDKEAMAMQGTDQKNPESGLLQVAPASSVSEKPRTANVTDDPSLSPRVVGGGEERFAGLGGAPPAGLLRPSSWFRDQRQGSSMSWLDGAGPGAGVSGLGVVVRPLPAGVRWVFMCLLDSLFFSVKEPIEGLDRHPAVHALLENVLAVSSCCKLKLAASIWRWGGRGG